MSAPAIAVDLSKIPLQAKALHAGLKIGYLLLLSRTPENPKHSQMTRKRWRVQCTAPNCSTRFTIPANYLIRRPNPRTHCGCLTPTSLKVEYKREYGIWCMMRVRTSNPKHVSWKHYGGRGIKVCPQWADPETGFDVFLRDMGPAPSTSHTLDRIDVDGDYTPTHPVTGKRQVKWSTPKEQAQNTRKAKANHEAQTKRTSTTKEPKAENNQVGQTT